MDRLELGASQERRQEPTVYRSAEKRTRCSGEEPRAQSLQGGGEEAGAHRVQEPPGHHLHLGATLNRAQLLGTVYSSN